MRQEILQHITQLLPFGRFWTFLDGMETTSTRSTSDGLSSQPWTRVWLRKAKYWKRESSMLPPQPMAALSWIPHDLLLNLETMQGIWNLEHGVGSVHHVENWPESRAGCKWQSEANLKTYLVYHYIRLELYSDSSWIKTKSWPCMALLVSLHSLASGSIGSSWAHIMGIAWNCTTVRPRNRTKPMEAKSDNDIASGLGHLCCITLPERCTSHGKNMRKWHKDK